MMKNQLPLMFGALAIGLGIATGGYFVSQTMLNQRVGANIASVKGLSERIVPADAATWHLDYSLRSENFLDIEATFQRAEEHLDSIKKALESAGFTSDEFIAGPLQRADKRVRNKDGDVIERYYVIASNVFISTSEPEKIGEAAKAISALTRKGIAIRQSAVNYEFTRLNEIKPDMLREATENARIAADKFAENAGVKVGGIQRAIQGGFAVQPANTGDAKKRKINKLVRVVTTITFYLEN